MISRMDASYAPLFRVESSQFCPDCRKELLDELKEFLVDMLARATGLNLVIMADMPVPDAILESIELKEKGSVRRLTMKEAAELKEEASTKIGHLYNWLTTERRASQTKHQRLAVSIAVVFVRSSWDASIPASG